MESDDETLDHLLIPFIEDLSNSVNYDSPGFPRLSSRARVATTLVPCSLKPEPVYAIVPIAYSDQVALVESQNVITEHDKEEAQHKRSVSFSPSQGSTESEEEAGEEEVEELGEVVETTSAYEKRTLELDTLCGLLGRICRTKGQWLKFIPKTCPVERQNFASPEALALWKVVAEDVLVPHDDNYDPAMVANVGIRLMASMWDDLVHMVFAGLFKRIPGREMPKPTVDHHRPADIAPHDWVAERIIRRYQVFESLPLHPTLHRNHCLRVYKLAAAAIELRDALDALNHPETGDPRHRYEIYSPLRQNSSDVRFALLRNQNRQVAHLVTDDAVVDRTHVHGISISPSSSDDVDVETAQTSHLLAMTLCGGLVRRPRKTMRDRRGRRMRMRKKAVYERKAAVATVSPQRTGLTKIRHFMEGSNDDILMHQNRLRAGALADDVQGNNN